VPRRIPTVTPSPHHPPGVKGMGEPATVGAPPAIANAVVDALSHLGVSHIDIPVTPPREGEKDPARERGGGVAKAASPVGRRREQVASACPPGGAGRRFGLQRGSAAKGTVMLHVARLWKAWCRRTAYEFSRNPG
jgi:hypothetical protein